MVRVAASRRERYTHDVEIEGGHSLIVDEPEAAGGADLGPSPTRLLGASLAACTAITVEMYANRKEWDLGALRVEVEIGYEGSRANHFEVTLVWPPGLSGEQREKLLVIAGKCPVHRVLAPGAEITIGERAGEG